MFLSRQLKEAVPSPPRGRRSSGTAPADPAPQALRGALMRPQTRLCAGGSTNAPHLLTSCKMAAGAVRPGSCSPPPRWRRGALSPVFIMFPPLSALKMSPSEVEASDYHSQDAKEGGGAGRGHCLLSPSPSAPLCMLGVVVFSLLTSVSWRPIGTQCPACPAAVGGGAGSGGKGR